MDKKLLTNFGALIIYKKVNENVLRSMIAVERVRELVINISNIKFFRSIPEKIEVLTICVPNEKHFNAAIFCGIRKSFIKTLKIRIIKHNHEIALKYFRKDMYRKIKKMMKLIRNSHVQKLSFYSLICEMPELPRNIRELELINCEIKSFRGGYIDTLSISATKRNLNGLKDITKTARRLIILGDVNRQMKMNITRSINNNIIRIDIIKSNFRCLESVKKYTNIIYVADENNKEIHKSATNINKLIHRRELYKYRHIMDILIFMFKNRGINMSKYVVKKIMTHILPRFLVFVNLKICSFLN